MEVRDDGVGLSEDGLAALHKGIGVSTTRARLQHLFGADFRFEFHRHKQGVAVIVALPWRVESLRPACRSTAPTAPMTRSPAAGDLSAGIAATVRQFALTHRHNQDGIPIMKKIKTLIVDDEPLARERLAGAAGARTGHRDRRRSAATAKRPSWPIQDHSPDLVFLDVQMPQMNGFEVIDAVGAERMPLVIFVTAYDQHALQGLPGPRARLPAQAVRPRALHRSAAARAASRSSATRPAISGAGCWRSSRTCAAISREPIASSSSPAAGCSSCGRTRSTGSRRPATTSASTSARRRTCCARR